MPIQYSSVLDEHRACREHGVVFDVSHLGSVHVRGAGAFATLQWALTNDLDRIGPGRAQYTHLLDPDDAHVVDDIIVWWTVPGDFLVMPNASNTSPLVDALSTRPRCTVAASARSTTSPTSRAVIAVQGPEARSLLATGLPRGGRGGALRGAAVRVRRRARLGRGHRLHGRRRRRAARARGGGGRVLARARRRRAHPGRARRARHVAARGRAPAPRPRAGPGHHAAAGRAGLGGPLRQGRLPRSRRARSRAHPGCGSPSAGARHRGPADPARGPGRLARRCRRRRGDAAATSRRRSVTASRWRSSLPTPPRATPSPSTCGDARCRHS